jgi:hypothetical protein
VCEACEACEVERLGRFIVIVEVFRNLFVYIFGIVNGQTLYTVVVMCTPVTLSLWDVWITDYVTYPASEIEENF